jgi:hypothetical protein
MESLRIRIIGRALKVVVPIGTLQTGYPRVQALSQDKVWGDQPCATMCPTAPDPASQLRWVPVLPRVQRLWNPPPWWKGLRRRHVYRGFGPTGRALVHHVSCVSGSCLLVGRAPGPHASYAPPPVGHGPQVQRKAQQAYLCGKARLFPMHVRTFSWCLTSEPSWACKTCGQASLSVLVRRADMRLQCSANAADHPPGTTTVYGDLTA